MHLWAFLSLETTLCRWFPPDRAVLEIPFWFVMLLTASHNLPNLGKPLPTVILTHVFLRGKRKGNVRELKKKNQSPLREGKKRNKMNCSTSSLGRVVRESLVVRFLSDQGAYWGTWSNFLSAGMWNTKSNTENISLVTLIQHLPLPVITHTVTV